VAAGFCCYIARELRKRQCVLHLTGFKTSNFALIGGARALRSRNDGTSLDPVTLSTCDVLKIDRILTDNEFFGEAHGHRIDSSSWWSSSVTPVIDPIASHHQPDEVDGLRVFLLDLELAPPSAKMRL
jgi:hypothetical protein